MFQRRWVHAGCRGGGWFDRGGDWFDRAEFGVGGIVRHGTGSGDQLFSVRRAFGVAVSVTVTVSVGRQ